MNYSEIAKEFVISGEIANIKPFGSGHINDTFLITDENGHKYELQKVNGNVFKKPERVMKNIIGITDYLHKHSKNGMKTLEFVNCKNGKKYYKEPSGDV